MDADADATIEMAPTEPKRASEGRQRSGGGLLLVLAVAGALVALSLGIYGRTHVPTGRPLALLIGFTEMTPMKVWLATAGVLLGIFQVVSAAWMWGRLPTARKAPRTLPQSHRWSGSLAFLATLPVAYHCLWSLGYSTFDTRTALHSFFGCAFYGAFTTKMLVLRSKALPGWALPVAGGLLFALLIGAWATAGLWYFTQAGVPLR